MIDGTPTAAVTDAGQDITHNIIVTNNGNQTLNNILVNDPLTNFEATITSLAPGFWVFTTTYTTNQDDIDTAGGGDGDIDNTATADSDQTDPVSDLSSDQRINRHIALNASIAFLLTKDENTLSQNDTDSVFVNVMRDQGLMALGWSTIRTQILAAGR